MKQKSFIYVLICLFFVYSTVPAIACDKKCQEEKAKAYVEIDASEFMERETEIFSSGIGSTFNNDTQTITGKGFKEGQGLEIGAKSTLLQAKEYDISEITPKGEINHFGAYQSEINVEAGTKNSCNNFTVKAGTYREQNTETEIGDNFMSGTLSGLGEFNVDLKGTEEMLKWSVDFKAIDGFYLESPNGIQAGSIEKYIKGSNQ